jgi:hypothetical protein
MRQLRAFSIASVLLLGAALASGADLSGKWVAQMQGPNGEARDITFNLTANGDQVTGTITTPRGDNQISDGKISGNQITFTEVLDFNGNKRTIQYTGKLSDDGNSIEFTRSMQGGPGGPGGGGGQGGGGRRGGMNRTITAKRASS